MTIGEPSNLERIRTVCLFILTVIAVCIALIWLRPVLIPFLLAAIITITLDPIIDWMGGKLKVSRYLAMGVTFLLGTAIVVGLGVLITFSVRGVLEGDTYTESINQLIETTVELVPVAEFGLHEPGTILDASGDVVPQETLDQIAEDASRGIESTAIHSEAPGYVEQISQQSWFKSSVGSLATWTANFLTEVISTGSLVLIFMLFLMLGKAMSESSLKGSAKEIVSSIKKYLVTKFVISLFTGIATTGVLLLFGVDLALVLGILAFLLNFIPSIGSLLGTILPLPLILLHPELGWHSKTICFALIAGAQGVLGNVIEPKMMGESLDLHPIVVLLTLIFFGLLWGPIGMLLATPLTAAIKILLSNAEFTKPLAEALAGRVNEVFGTDFAFGFTNGDEAPPESPESGNPEHDAAKNS